ncbi:MAG TPA: hypothetical protein VGC97_06445 [Pyrinomonadaceae bacterium]|jgi:hypothetical protein
MNVTDLQEIWQVDTGGQIFEGKFEELAQWIFEDSLLPQDYVRRRNLRWIEARRVPGLMQFFDAKERGLPPPVFASTSDAQTAFENPSTQPQNFAPTQTFASNGFETNIHRPAENSFQASQNPFETAATAQNFQNETARHEPQFTNVALPNEPPPHEFNVMPTADFCSMHPDMPTAFLCGTCGNGFCPACPKSYGGNVKICPFCGALCKSVKEVVEKVNAAMRYEYDISYGFGMKDFFNALAYPFKYKTSLFVGAIMFMLFTLGQGAGSMGSIFMAGAGLICWMSANMLTFGVMANTVENFAQGKIGGNFMPSFDDFSLWEDVVHPFFLSIGVYLVSFGLVILILVGSIIWGLNQVSNSISDSYKSSEKADIIKQRDEILKGNPNIQKQNEFYGDKEMPDESRISRSQNYPPQSADEQEFEKANKTLREAREQQYESARKELETGAGKPPETEHREKEQALRNLFGMAFPIVILLIIGLLWGIFYFPAACCVAGYTRSFVATLNPTIGLETIRLLGWDYLKIWGMGFLIVIMSVVVSFILALVFRAFDMPTVGNVPAKIVGALFTFYFSVVFSVVLGFALHKNADKMNLFKG